ncbi:carotenoid biosynthesis protein [Mucilaginibacter sp.]|jgi:hypothetical protein|uniref:carotenoid biosynthesis protein n=1 Tax=Mucilaginibacter sp. TaxID=1882438 RepID=UPI003569B6F9
MNQPPPYPGMPTGPAPAWVFPVFELAMYVLLLFCLVHAWRKGPQSVAYLLGGLFFGVLLEYMEVAMYSYSYGNFWIMIGTYPITVPLCIGVGWGIIMYSARLFTDRLGLALWACAALDTLLAINIDLSMDTVACRLHMWNWNWGDPHINTMTTQWFGIPYANFVGWQTVVFCFSAFSRLFERTKLNAALIAIFALLCSLFVLYATEEWLFPLLNKIGITSGYRFSGLTLIFIGLVIFYWRKRTITTATIPAVALWVPGWFHLFFFAGFWIFGFYTEQTWMTVAACVNLLIGFALHYRPLFTRTSYANRK